MKQKRQMAILNLIENEEISTQEELSEKLIKMGFKVTQATVSRDIKELKLLKVHSETKGNKYGYITPDLNKDDGASMSKLNSILSEAVKSCDFANNIVIIKTIQGMAQGVGFALDNLNDLSVMGSIAGDDTVMVVTKTEKSAENLVNKIKKIIK